MPSEPDVVEFFRDKDGKLWVGIPASGDTYEAELKAVDPPTGLVKACELDEGIVYVDDARNLYLETEGGFFEIYFGEEAEKDKELKSVGMVNLDETLENSTDRKRVRV